MELKPGDYITCSRGIGSQREQAQGRIVSIHEEIDGPVAELRDGDNNIIKDVRLKDVTHKKAPCFRKLGYQEVDFNDVDFLDDNTYRPRPRCGDDVLVATEKYHHRGRLISTYLNSEDVADETIVCDVLVESSSLCGAHRYMMRGVPRDNVAPLLDTNDSKALDQGAVTYDNWAENTRDNSAKISVVLEAVKSAAHMRDAEPEERDKLTRALQDAREVLKARQGRLNRQAQRARERAREIREKQARIQLLPPEGG